MNNTKVQLGALWCGPIGLITYGIAFWAIAGFMPPSSPLTSPEALVAFYEENRTGIRIGQLLGLICSTFFFPFFAVISVQVARIEGGRFPVLGLSIFGGMTLLMVYFYMCGMLWIGAAYRPDIAPEILRLIHETSWLMFVMVYPEYTMTMICIAIAGFIDKSPDPIFPRWYAWFALWVGLSAIGGGFAEFFYKGPFAWNGFFGFWLPVALFTLWIGVTTPLMARHIRRQAAAEAGAATPGQARVGAAQLSPTRG
jgi:hypothetical protein